MLNKPDLVATDANGTVYVHDSMNQYIRIIDPATKLMRTMIDGSCRLDYLTNKPKLRVPFQLHLKPMVCFRSWIKTFGDPEDHLVRITGKIEILDPSAVIDGYGDQIIEESVSLTDGVDANSTNNATGNGTDEGEGSEVISELALKCYDFHQRTCPYFEPHPLIKEKEFYDFRQDYIQ